MTSTEQLTELAAEFWQWRAIHQPVTSDDLARLERPANWQADWSAASIERQRAQLELFEERWRRLDHSGEPVATEIDHRLIGSALARVRWELDVTRGWRRSPKFYVDQTLVALFEALLRPAPFESARGEELIRLLRNIPRTLEAGRINLAAEAVQPFAQAALALLAGVRSRLDRVRSELKPLLAAGCAERFDQALTAAIESFESFQAWIEERLPSMPEDSAVGRDAYLFFLREVALMPYTPEQLLVMGQQEWERALAFEAIAQERARRIPPLPLFPDQAAQVAREAEDELKIRRFLEEQNLLTVPAWVRHYRNLPMPSYLLPLSDLGVADDLTSPNRLHEDGISYIFPPSPNLWYFALASARDPRPIIVHEGVPGHYFQMVLAWAHEDPIRRHYYDSGPMEGIGFYSEELMVQAGLFDDSPRTREIMYNFMRLRALRVEVDVKLALGLFTIDQAADYLQTRTPMDAETARFEAVFFASIPGQAITYQIGKLQILKFLAEARQILGAGFNLRAFHDYLWKNGNVPISLQRLEYLGLRDEQGL
ncbi:MAG TPA: DUF885 family protein [Blastocatellia bacterium]|nr:DUF885 family protein [Blastocatellia bacterium]